MVTPRPAISFTVGYRHSPLPDRPERDEAVADHFDGRHHLIWFGALLVRGHRTLLHSVHPLSLLMPSIFAAIARVASRSSGAILSIPVWTSRVAGPRKAMTKWGFTPCWISDRRVSSMMSRHFKRSLPQPSVMSKAI